MSNIVWLAKDAVGVSKTVTLWRDRPTLKNGEWVSSNGGARAYGSQWTNRVPAAIDRALKPGKTFAAAISFRRVTNTGSR